jgi:hypothetical protein
MHGVIVENQKTTLFFTVPLVQFCREEPPLRVFHKFFAEHLEHGVATPQQRQVA